MADIPSQQRACCEEEANFLGVLADKASHTQLEPCCITNLTIERTATRFACPYTSDGKERKIAQTDSEHWLTLRMYRCANSSQPKRLKSSSSSSATSTATTSQSQVHMAKKRATLKEKAGKGNTAHDSKRVLGDVDYVALMMGGRRKAKQEAEKLAHDA